MTMPRDALGSEEAATEYLLAKTVVIVTHVRGLGPSNHLEKYVKQRCRRVLAIDHPLIFESHTASTYRLYEDNELISEGRHSLLRHEILARFQEVWITARWVRCLAPRGDLFIGVDALNCFAGLLVKVFRQTKRVVFYVIDWSPMRFDSRVLNTLYHFTDRFAAVCASETWNQSDAIDKGRWQGSIWALVGRRVQGRVRIVPNAVPRLNGDVVAKPRHPYQLVFLGHLLEKQGLQLAIEALPQISRRYRDVQLVIIGSGPYRDELERLSVEAGVSDRVKFLGYVEDENEVLQHLCSSTCGLAPYIESEESYTNFADPGKLKNYLASGLSIVMTNVPHNSKELERVGCAVLVDGTADGVAEGVCKLLSESEPARRRRREKAIQLMAGLDWESVFARAFCPRESAL